MEREPFKVPELSQMSLNASIFIYVYTLLILCVVRRVHWLRARAQLMRWQEELTLTGYEMQWTVRYFLYMSRKWVLKFDGHPLAPEGSNDTGTGTGTGHSPGAIPIENTQYGRKL